MDSAHEQDRWDRDNRELPQNDPQTGLLLRLLVNLGKYLSARWSVAHIHQAIDILGGNGTIESFSSLPRLFRDSIVCENWEGTHNTLRMQTLRDILHHRVDHPFRGYIDRKLALLQAEPALLQPLQQYRSRLDRQLTELAQADAPLQSLLIKKVVDSMAILHCATCLLEEALHQQRLRQGPGKLLQYRYFSQLRLTPDQSRYDADYLVLIASIIKT